MAQSTDTPQENITQIPQPHHKILGQTLGSLLRENTGARETVMKAMRITPEKFEEMLISTEDNQLMHMTIGDLFKNGIIQKAVGEEDMPLTAEQITALENNEPVMQKKIYIKEEEKKTFVQKIKGLFIY